MTPAPPSRSDWIHRPEADLFSEANLEAVRTAFRRPSGVVFGWQYFYAGGSSRSAIAFTAYDQYLHHIERARLGDHFTLFELDALLDRAVVHIGDIHSTGRLALDEPVIDLADEDAEVLIVRRFVGPLTRAVDATVTELPGTSDERLEQFKRDLVWGRGELVIFDQRSSMRMSMEAS